MDLSINVENYKLNIRAAAVIIHNNKVLAHKNAAENHYALIGGRVAAGEDSEQAVVREVEEELGKKVEVTSYGPTIENFFELKGRPYHEILFVHKAEFVDDDDKKIEHTLKNIEGKAEFAYEWLDIDRLDEYELMPTVIKSYIKNEKDNNHIIHYD